MTTTSPSVMSPAVTAALVASSWAGLTGSGGDPSPVAGVRMLFLLAFILFGWIMDRYGMIPALIVMFLVGAWALVVVDAAVDEGLLDVEHGQHLGRHLEERLFPLGKRLRIDSAMQSLYRAMHEYRSTPRALLWSSGSRSCAATSTPTGAPRTRFAPRRR